MNLMNPLYWSYRICGLFGFVACISPLIYAIFLQFTDGLNPCPLCILQRLAFLALGIIFLIAALHNPIRRWLRGLYGVLAMITVLIGAGIAGRHVYIQSLPPDDFASCGPPLAFLRETMGPFEVLRTMLTGTADCAEIDWMMFGLTMPQWSLVCFICLGIWAVWTTFFAPYLRPQPEKTTGAAE